MMDPAVFPGPEGVGRVGPGAPPPPKTDAPEGKSFSDILAESMDKVNQLQQESGAAQAAFASGATDNVEDVMIAVRKADVAFKMLMQIRNKLVDAYDELQRMRI